MIPILTTTSTVMCPHGGQAVLATSNTEACVDGAPMLLLTDVHVVVGCPFAPAAPSPCTTIRWLSGAAQTALRGVPVLLQTSVGLCLNAAQAPQGPAVVVQTQQRAQGI
ncbi:hypothetical protein [Tahibacter caeni]|uniref:hypothetical protein n=1 Tax=Tahibacter caeni TaxID=1453545 RepID=UPI0021480F49|nr:hypothetical protein [Tahibacter caeni]